MNGQDREQTELLRNIWNEMKVLGSGLSRRIDGVREEIGQTNVRLDSVEQVLRQEIGLVRTELGEGIGQTNVRLGSVEQVLSEFADQQLSLTRYVRISVEGHDEAIDDLRKRVGRLEAASSTPANP